MPVTSHAAHTYLPEPKRSGIALCLSGGGFRAALFHLGAVRRLNELGILSRVDTITAVSGGTTIAAHLAHTRDAWQAGPLDASEWERTVAVQFREFTSKNLSYIPILKGWMPWNWFNNAGVEALARNCTKLTDLTVHTLPDSPRFLFGATDLVTGTGWIFERANEVAWPVATAVAVSSCYPVYFRPFTKSKPQWIRLVDGGVDDNRGVDPVWRTHETLLVSDGGDVLRPAWGESFFWSLMRSAQVLWNQTQEAQKRWLLAGFISRKIHGTYWGIDSTPAHYEEEGSLPFPGYSAALVRDVIAVIRTDYDAFSDVEAAVLENHGYLLAEAATRTHVPQLRINPDAPLEIPHPAWMGERKVREALKDSWKKRFFGRW